MEQSVLTVLSDIEELSDEQPANLHLATDEFEAWLSDGNGDDG